MPSIVELLERLVVMEQALARANERIEALEAENAELRRRLGQSPRNSNMPPSAQGLDKPAPKSLRGRSGRRAGGQDGHPGRTLRQVDDPDETVCHEPAACVGCGSGLTDAPLAAVTRRQVFEIPQIRARVTEHQLIARRCSCATVTCADAPAGVDAPVQYGPRLAAIVVYLLVAQFGAQKRVAQTIADVFGVPISQGSVAALTARAAVRLEGDFLTAIRVALAAAPLVHFDETGFRVAGRLHWVHSASTGKYSLLYVHPKRGRTAIDAGGVLPDFTGIAVHDAWAPYDCYSQATHALCCAHLLRELVAAQQFDPSATWAAQGIEALLTLKNAADAAVTAGLDHIDPEVLASGIASFRHAALVGIKDHAGQGSPIGKKLAALARRMRERIDDYLRFAHDPRNCPFDNNAAEREVRMVKIRQKISGAMRTQTGAEHFCHLRSYLATATKHGLNLYDALVQLTSGRPWIPAIS
ncbi:IS66 family transposase [Actinoplanes sp. NPDC026619]|uniref:IS66 family transposase n=1 Tax=Actinoplanes sp. NPDC026619 TaxID=3155798 RepID=UPI00340E2579